MKIFLYFLSLIAGIILCNKDTYFIGIVSLLIIFVKLFLNKNYSKKCKIISLIFFSFGLFIINVPIKSFQSENIKGIVITKKENYLLLYDGLETFYVKTENKNIDLFDCVEINGELQDLHFITLESEFDFENYLKNKGVEREIVPLSENIIFDFPINFNLFKEKVLGRIKEPLVKEFASSILFNTSKYDDPLKSNFRDLRLVNLIALSGTFISFVLYTFKKVFSFFVNDKLSSWLALLALSPFIFFSINTLPTLRVLILFLLNLINKEYLKNKFGRIEIISISGIILLLISPYNVFQFSFIIPFTIVTILNFSQLLIYRHKKISQFFIKKIILLGVFLPFMIQFYNSINIIGLILSSLFLSLSKFLFLLILPAFYGINFGFINTFIFKILNFSFYINIGQFDINVPPFNQFGYIVYFLIVLFLIYFSEINFKKILKFASPVLCSSLLLYCIPINNLIINKVSFINVGQGDAIYINYRLENYLIDTGGLKYKDLSESVLIPFLKKERVYDIDYLFITHDDFDHNGALESLKGNFCVKNIFTNNDDISKVNTKLKFNDLNIERDKYDNENDKSLVLNFEISGVKFLLMGDSSKKVEEDILKNFKNLKADILKVGHHGSNTSTSENFIETLQPKEAIISCGENNFYNHPHKEVIKILENNDVKIRRTDKEGTITYNYF